MFAFFTISGLSVPEVSGDGGGSVVCPGIFLEESASGVFVFIVVLSEVTGVMLKDCFAKHAAVDVRVDFRSAYGFVSQHHLDGTQVGSTFQQMGGEEWRKVWGLTVLCMPASSTSSLMK